MNRDLIAAIDVGGTKIFGALITKRGKLLIREKSRVPKGASSAAVVKRIVSTVRMAAAKVPNGLKRVAAVGIGVPGTVDAAVGKVVSTPNIDLSGVRIGPRLKKAFGRPVAVGNDVNLALAGEHWLGAGRGCRDLVAIFPGTGVGGGIIANGKLVTGANGGAAEIGHLIVRENGPRCGCGNRGCLEAVASRRAIEGQVRKAVNNGQKTLIKKINGGSLSIIRSKVFKRAIKKGDPLAKKVIQDAAGVLGGACVSLRHLFDPEKFIFGGGLIEACGKHILPVIRRHLAKDPFFKSFKSCEVVSAELGDDAVLFGAAAEAVNLL